MKRWPDRNAVAQQRLYFIRQPQKQSAMRKFVSSLLLVWSALGVGLSPGTAAAGLTSPPDSPFIVESWSTDDGLPQSSVITVLQTHDGYLWLGTLTAWFVSTACGSRCLMKTARRD